MLPLLALETVLRIWMPLPVPQVVAGVDHAPLVDLHQLRPLFEPSPDGTEMQIGQQRSNFFQPASFKQTKPKGGRRIFVLGGSTVQGRPYATETAFPKLLEIQLNTTFPAIDWEVINCGGVSYASYRLDVIAEEVLRYSPDGLVVYTGHNEFLEARTYAAYRSIPRPVARWYAIASRSELVRRLASMVRPAAAKQSLSPETLSPKTLLPGTLLPEEVDARLDHTGGLEAYKRNPDYHRSVVHHFETTLRRIADRCDKADVPLVFCVPASEIVRTPPFKSTLPADPTTPLEQAWTRMHDPDRDPAARRSMAEQILRMDPENAAANYLLGRDAWEQSRYEQAAAYLLKARDADVCPLRATSEMEQIVRTVAGASSKRQIVRLLDVPNLFASAQAKQVCQPTRFVDHVHPQIHGGHTQIATELFTQLTSIGELDLTAPHASAEARQTAVAEYLDQINEAYYHRGKQRIEGLKTWAAGRAGGEGPAD